MSDAADRIRVWPDYNDHTTPVSEDWTGGYWDNTDDPKGTEYTRTELVRAEIEAAVRRALDGAAEVVMRDYESVLAEEGERSGTAWDMRQDAAAIRALDPAQFIDGDKT